MCDRWLKVIRNISEHAGTGTEYTIEYYLKLTCALSHILPPITLRYLQYIKHKAKEQTLCYDSEGRTDGLNKGRNMICNKQFFGYVKQ